MTYVVGIHSKETTVLIADSRVTFEGNCDHGHNYALKSGGLFPGCIYAAVGDVAALRRFIKSAKFFLTGRRTLLEFWDKFIRYFKAYDKFDEMHHFQLLLSSRHSGKPCFYIADSKSASVTQQKSDIVLLGSGKCLLDEIVNSLYRQRHASILQEIISQNAPVWFFGYWYCLALTECSQESTMYHKLNEIGVGGIFHFSYQTGTEEHRQHPAVYDIIINSPNTNTVKHLLYRVTFEKMALVIENPTENKYAISIDDAVWPKCNDLNTAELKSLTDEIFQGAAAQPFYNFLGIGFSEAQHRGVWLCHINLGSNQYVITRNKIEHPFIIEFTRSVLSGTQIDSISPFNASNPSPSRLHTPPARR